MRPVSTVAVLSSLLFTPLMLNAAAESSVVFSPNAPDRRPDNEHLVLAGGAAVEVQGPFAAVVVGGLFGMTFLTLLALPRLYRRLFERRQTKGTLA